jgi:hypothetical protein
MRLMAILAAPAGMEFKEIGDKVKANFLWRSH